MREDMSSRFGGFLLTGRALALGLLLAPQGRLNPVNQALWQLIRPLSKRLRGDANGIGRVSSGCAEQFNGFLFLHATLKHAFTSKCNHSCDAATQN